MGPPPRSFAADAHDCIMVRVLGPTGYKVVARLIAPASGLPSDRHPDRTKRAAVLGAVKVWPGNGGACRKVGRRANLDRSSRADVDRGGRDEETVFQIEQRNRRRKKDAPPPCRNSLKSPIQGNRGKGYEGRAAVRYGDLSVAFGLKVE